jgi:hypothetical protein
MVIDLPQGAEKRRELERAHPSSLKTKAIA